MNAARLLFRGSVLSGADQIVRGIAALLIAPVVLSHLGIADFGAWVLLSGLFSQFTLLDPGLRSSLPHFLSAPDERGDEAELRTVASTAFLAYGAITLVSAVLTLIIWLAMPLMVNEPHLLTASRGLTLALGLMTCVGSLTRVFPIFLQSRLRKDLISLVGLLRVILCNLLIWWLLTRRGAGLETMGLVHAIGGALEALVLTFCGRGLIPHIRTSWATKAMARRLMGFSGWSYLITTSERLRSGLDSFILGWLRGSPSAGLYSLGLRPVAMVSETVYACIGNQLLPTFSRLQEAGGKNRLHHAFLVITRLSTVLSACCAVMLLAVGPTFLHCWVPSQAAQAIPVLLLLAVPFALQTAQVPAIHLLYAVNEHRALALAQSAAVALNLVLSCVLAWWLGLIGAALGTAVDILLVHGVVLPILVARKGGVPLREFLWLSQLQPLLVCLAMSLVPMVMIHYWLPPTASFLALGLVSIVMAGWLAGWLWWITPLRSDLLALQRLTGQLGKTSASEL